jgi:hypothetical protein
MHSSSPSVCKVTRPLLPWIEGCSMQALVYEDHLPLSFVYWLFRQPNPPPKPINTCLFLAQLQLGARALIGENRYTHLRSVRPTWVFKLVLVVARDELLGSLRFILGHKALFILVLGPGWSALDDDDSFWPDFSMSAASSRTEITLETLAIFSFRFPKLNKVAKTVSGTRGSMAPYRNSIQLAADARMRMRRYAERAGARRTIWAWL